MNPKLKQTLLTLTTTLSAILIVTTATYAIGTLTPLGTVGNDTQVSLNDIYGALDDFSNHTVASTTNPFTVPEPVAASFHTLSEIYALISAESSDLVPSNLAAGVTVFGVVGTLSTTTPALQWSADEPSGIFVDESTASLYCASLIEGGHTDWRLPTYLELVNAYFTEVPDFQGDSYWSSTLYSNNTENAYIVSMASGLGTIGDRANLNGFARCAR